MKGLFAVLFIFVIVSPSLCARLRSLNASPSFNVVNYGAKGDGQTDDSQAFVKAWQDVCHATQGAATLVIPKGKTFKLQPVSFHGPCKPATINIELQGTISAPENAKSWRWASDDRKAWVVFSDIFGLVINGGGTVDGQGAAWWHSTGRPTALQFHNCENLRLSSSTHINSPKNHISIDGCNGSRISDLSIVAPEDSPNTDGIDIVGSTNIVIQNSIIKTGDDCVAIKAGSSFINITGVMCGPGHGISVGSLGEDGAYDTVEEIHVRNCTFNGTTNGGRIKTWTGGSGYGRKITFEHIILVGVKNPVIIDQNYGEIEESSGGQKAVKISNVTYRNVTGTASYEDAVLLNCDPRVGCTNIVMEHIGITSETGGKIQASCTNAHGTCSSCNPIVPCLSTK